MAEMMPIEKEPFKSYTLEEDKEEESREITSVSIEKDYRINLLEPCKKILQQKKDSTALKQMAEVGANVILSKEISLILAIVFRNRKNNKRLNIIDYEDTS